MVPADGQRGFPPFPFARPLLSPGTLKSREFSRQQAGNEMPTGTKSQRVVHLLVSPCWETENPIVSPAGGRDVYHHY